MSSMTRYAGVVPCAVSGKRMHAPQETLADLLDFPAWETAIWRAEHNQARLLAVGRYSAWLAIELKNYAIARALERIPLWPIESITSTSWRR